ncbi:hypothetical protein ACIBHX_35835 [Nonomuraea sp. NPDC050536]|uniref:hypothetical protein n=1 Tax=Nonomuraea sp. NPDC050536 TaxID=3364366 RepID=UPI0037C97117
MGVLFDYYRAADREAAMVLPELGRAGNRRMPEGQGFDAVDAKGIEPAVILGQLIGLIQGVPWSVGLVEMVEIYPPSEGAPRTEEEWEALPPDSPFLDGPGIEELSAAVRDTLADVDHGRMAELAEQWAGIEEFDGRADAELLRGVIEELVGLARRAKESGQLLYCWTLV